MAENKSVTNLGGKISQLLNFVTQKTNVHKEIVTLAREIEALFLEMSVECEDNGSMQDNRMNKINVHTQTDNPVETQFYASENRQSGDTSQTIYVPQIQKRGAITQSPKNSRPKRKKNSISKNVTVNRNDLNVVEANEAENSEDPGPHSEWQKVKPRGKKRPIQSRPDALVIKASANSTYADILKQVKSDPKLKFLGENVHSIRKTGKGELLLQLTRTANENTGLFRHSIEDVLGPGAEVRALTQEVLVEVKDIDEVTSREEVLDAIRGISDEFKSLTTSSVKSMRKAYGDTQTATVALNAGLASQLISMSKIRIGWVVCRIREKIKPIRCYKCFDFGHSAHKCKSHQDYSRNCLKCGEIGHKIGTCTNEPSCLLCKNDNGNHVTGCTICPFYKKAIQGLRMRK